jgi:hypothetical protein
MYVCCDLYGNAGLLDCKYRHRPVVAEALLVIVAARERRDGFMNVAMKTTAVIVLSCIIRIRSSRGVLEHLWQAPVVQEVWQRADS